MKFFIIVVFDRIFVFLQNIMRFYSSIIKKLSILFSNIKRKGNEYITIMFVPHSEKSILNFQVSYFTIFYVIFIVSVPVLIGIFSVLGQATVRQEVLNLREKDKQWEVKDSLLSDEIKTLCKLVDEIRPEMQKLNNIIGMKDGRVYDLWAVGGSSDSAVMTFTNEYNEEKLKLPSEVVDMRNAIEDINTSKECISKIKLFLKERETVLEKIPSVWPCASGGYITSSYGWRKHPFYRSKREWHRGLDIGCWPGAPIIATGQGVVAHAGWKSGYGLTIILEHDFGYSTFYAHCSALKVRIGQKVKKGQIIGYIGRTGRTTGFHLHYEVRIGNKDVDPLTYIINVR